MAGLESFFSLDGTTVMVTGAGSGLGRAMAEAVASAGARVWCVDKDGDAAAATATSIGARGFYAQLDVGDAAQVDQVVHTICAQGEVDVLFNNAGVNGPAVPLHEVSPGEWDEAMAVNLRGMYLCDRAVLGHLVAGSRHGKIIHTASVWGSLGVVMRAMPAYAAAKGAVVNLTRELALEYGSRGITCNAIAPLGFITNIGGGASFRDPDIRRRLESKIPLGRLAQPEEIGGLAIFLASPSSNFMNGAIATIDGGFSAA